MTPRTRSRRRWNVPGSGVSRCATHGWSSSGSTASSSMRRIASAARASGALARLFTTTVDGEEQTLDLPDGRARHAAGDGGDARRLREALERPENCRDAYICTPATRSRRRPRSSAFRSRRCARACACAAEAARQPGAFEVIARMTDEQLERACPRVPGLPRGGGRRPGRL